MTDSQEIFSNVSQIYFYRVLSSPDFCTLPAVRLLAFKSYGTTRFKSFDYIFSIRIAMNLLHPPTHIGFFLFLSSAVAYSVSRSGIQPAPDLHLSSLNIRFIRMCTHAAYRYDRCLRLMNMQRRTSEEASHSIIENIYLQSISVIVMTFDDALKLSAFTDV
jgi:hypothetical protein